MRYDPLKMYVVSTLCSGHNAEISRYIGHLQNVITRWILKITPHILVSYTIIYTLPCPIVFGAIDKFSFFYPKCKLSDTPDCDWHVTEFIPIADTFRNDVLCNIFQKVSREWLNEIHACLMWFYKHGNRVALWWLLGQHTQFRHWDKQYAQFFTIYIYLSGGHLVQKKKQ